MITLNTNLNDYTRLEYTGGEALECYNSSTGEVKYIWPLDDYNYYHQIALTNSNDYLICIYSPYGSSSDYTVNGDNVTLIHSSTVSCNGPIDCGYDTMFVNNDTGTALVWNFDEPVRICGIVDFWDRNNYYDEYYYSQYLPLVSNTPGDESGGDGDSGDSGESEVITPPTGYTLINFTSDYIHQGNEVLAIDQPITTNKLAYKKYSAGSSYCYLGLYIDGAVGHEPMSDGRRITYLSIENGIVDCLGDSSLSGTVTEDGDWVIVELNKDVTVIGKQINAGHWAVENGSYTPTEPIDPDPGTDPTEPIDPDPGTDPTEPTDPEDGYTFIYKAGDELPFEYVQSTDYVIVDGKYYYKKYKTYSTGCQTIATSVYSNGAELPFEYVQSDEVVVDNGKYYYKKYKTYTLPNGTTAATDVYILGDELLDVTEEVETNEYIIVNGSYYKLIHVITTHPNGTTSMLPKTGDELPYEYVVSNDLYTDEQNKCYCKKYKTYTLPDGTTAKTDVYILSDELTYEYVQSTDVIYQDGHYYYKKYKTYTLPDNTTHKIEDDYILGAEVTETTIDVITDEYIIENGYYYHKIKSTTTYPSGEVEVNYYKGDELEYTYILTERYSLYGGSYYYIKYKEYTLNDGSKANGPDEQGTIITPTYVQSEDTMFVDNDYYYIKYKTWTFSDGSTIVDKTDYIKGAKYVPDYFSLTATGGGYVRIKLHLPSYSSVNKLEYMYDDESSFKTWNNDSVQLQLMSGSTIYFRANNTSYYANGENAYFEFSGEDGTKVKAGGNIMSLLYASDFSNKKEIPSENCFRFLFQDCTILTQAPKLPATTLKKNCYRGMFYGCTALTEMPELPATTLAEECYYMMFYKCNGLTTVHDLPAVNLPTNCYGYMFYQCISMTNAPVIYGQLTAYTYALQYMFYNCIKLTSITVKTKVWPTTSNANWVSNIGKTGTFYKPAALDISFGNDAVPYNWTVINL